MWVTKRLLSIPHVLHAVIVTRTKSPPVSGAETVSRLLAAAAKAFATKGFHATTTRDIAQGAGLSPAGVYVHFGSKLDVLFELSREGHRQALDLVRAAAAGSPSPSAALADILRRFSAWHVANYPLARVVYHEFGHLTDAQQDELLRLRRQIDRVVQDVLRVGTQTGEFVVDDVRDTSMALLSIVIDVARWYSPFHGRSAEQVGCANARLGLRLVEADRRDPPDQPEDPPTR